MKLLTEQEREKLFEELSSLTNNEVTDISKIKTRSEQIITQLKEDDKNKKLIRNKK